MKKALITGSSGFVGRYLWDELVQNGYEVTGLSTRGGENMLKVDLSVRESVFDAVKDTSPDVIFHLAGQADVGKSWKEPGHTFEVNVIGTINLLEAVRAIDPQIRVVLIGSSDQYGNLGEAGKLVSETIELSPQTPYAVSKLAQEKLAQVYVKAYSMDICMTRSFNHSGAGQREGFLISDFAAGIVRVEQGKSPCLRVGNLSSRRDFTHVSDVVRAYRLIAEKGQRGEIYNVGSGTAVSVQEILDKLISFARCPVAVEQDSDKMRPSDTPVVCCDHSKLTKDTGWEPIRSLDGTLLEMLEYYRSKEN